MSEVNFTHLLFDTMTAWRVAVVRLVQIEQQDFEAFLERGIREYAEDHVRNENWPAEGALERSGEQFEKLLPGGIHSKHQHLWSIIDDDNNKIGVLWVQVKDGKAFIFDFFINEAFRGRGYGKQALAAMDEKLKAMDVESVALHVFGDNITAQELYKRMGFEISGIHMRKKL